jgi:hypothetical protein
MAEREARKRKLPVRYRDSASDKEWTESDEDGDEEMMDLSKGASSKPSPAMQKPPHAGSQGATTNGKEEQTTVTVKKKGTLQKEQTSWIRHVFNNTGEKSASGKSVYACRWTRFSRALNHTEKHVHDGGNLARHFKVAHPTAYDKVVKAANDGVDVAAVVADLIAKEESKLQQSSISGFLRRNDSRRLKLISACVFAVQEGISQHALDSPYLREFFHACGQSRDVIYSRNTRERQVISSIFRAVCGNREEILDSVKYKFLSVTTDSWTSFDHRK